LASMDESNPAVDRLPLGDSGGGGDVSNGHAVAAGNGGEIPQAPAQVKADGSGEDVRKRKRQLGCKTIDDYEIQSVIGEGTFG
jgi:hypothetical protein